MRVRMYDRDGLHSLGSGTLVDILPDGSGLVVTNEHVVRDSGGNGQIRFQTGHTSPAKLIDYDAGSDLAVLRVSQVPDGLATAVIADRNPEAGEPLTIAGFGSQGRLLAQAGRCAGYSAEGRHRGANVIVDGANARQGDSGGPIFDSRGKLCGVLWGSDGQTWGCHVGPLRRLLDRIRARLGAHSPTSREPRTGQPAQSPADTRPSLPPGDYPQQDFPSGTPSAPATDPLVGLPGPLTNPADPQPPVITEPTAPAQSPTVKEPVVSPHHRPRTHPVLAAVGSLVKGELPALAGMLLAGALGGTGIGAPIAVLLARRSAAKLVAGALGAVVSHHTTLPLPSPAPAATKNQAAHQNPYAAPASLQPPTFVPTQVILPEFEAIKKALATLGGQTPQKAKWVQEVYGFSKQLLNQAPAT